MSRTMREDVDVDNDNDDDDDNADDDDPLSLRKGFFGKFGSGFCRLSAREGEVRRWGRRESDQYFPFSAHSWRADSGPRRRGGGPGGGE